MSKMKNTLDRFNNKLDTRKENITKLKIISMGIIKNEIQRVWRTMAK